MPKEWCSRSGIMERAFGKTRAYISPPDGAGVMGLLGEVLL